MIFDTDILSMFGKVGRIDLLRELFPKTSLVISFEVYNELLRGKEAGYDFVDDILEQGFRIAYLDSELIKEYEANKIGTVQKSSDSRTLYLSLTSFSPCCRW